MITGLYNIMILSKREFFATLFTPIAFIIAAVFLGVFGFSFYGSVRMYETATMRFTFSQMSMVLIFVIPIITMRSFAEERKSGTLETMLTTPITEFQLVTSKFIGCLVFFIFLLAPTGVYIYKMTTFGAQPEYTEIAVGYFGTILLAAVYISFGLMCSALVRDQIIAAFVACIALLGFNMLGMASGFVDSRFIGILNFLTFSTHHNFFTRGLIDTRSLVYFFCLIITFYFFTVKVVEAKKWQ